MVSASGSPSAESARQKLGAAFWSEAAGIAGLVGLAGFFLAVSWRRWPDPVIDFGRELYLPWRLANGAVLYRDVEDYFGPLSQYLNAILSRLAGPGLMVLVAGNLVILGGIVACLYGLFRRGWGVGAALGALAVFLSVFAFSQYNWCGNFNFVTPYAHETTHGFFVCLLLVLALERWVARETRRNSFAAGLFFGLACVLKPEFMLAGGALIAAAAIFRFREGRAPTRNGIAAMVVGAILPTLAFAIYFARFMPWPDAANAACGAWTNVFFSRFAGTALEWQYAGLDQPLIHLGQEALAAFWAGLFMALIGAGAWMVERAKGRGIWLAVLGALALALAWISIREVEWTEAGRCLPGFMAIYLVVLIFRPDPTARRGARITRILVAVAASALLARMILNARIYHYGFYQAALAAMVVPAFLLGEFAPRLKLGRKGTAALVIGTLALLVPGVVVLAHRSYDLLALKTVPVGSGADLFYATENSFTPTRGELVNVVSKRLRGMPPGQTLVVLPSCVMVNYLARLPSPVAPTEFFGFANARDGEERVVQALAQHPPDWIVILSRDLRDHGIERYGDHPGDGLQILEWVAQNYESAGAMGGDPLDIEQRGAVLLKRKALH